MFWRSSWAQNQHHFIGNAHVLLHAEFCPNLIILATTFCPKTVNLCEPPMKLQSFYRGWCHFNDNANVLLYAYFSSQAPYTANKCILHTLHVITWPVRYRIWYHFVGNVHVLLLTDFHCNPSLLAIIKNKHSATFSSERVRSSRSPNFELSISRQENCQSIQTLLSEKLPLNSPFHLKRELSAYSFK